MTLRTLFHFIVATAVLSATLSAQGKRGKPPGKIEPYSISVTALKGPAVTDVCVTVATDDAEYPIPAILKKLQIKALNQNGDVAYIRNFFDVPVTGDQACVSVPDLQAMMPLAVQALVQTSETVDTEVLQATGTVLFRPDLVIERVNAPDQSGPDVPFTVEVVVQENKFQSGATADVSLNEGETVLAVATGVAVPAGGQVSVLFTGLTLSESGTHDLTAKISNAVPAEFDESNNEFPFSILISSSVLSVPYILDYYHETNINLLIRNSECGVVVYEETQQGSRGEWNFGMSLPFAIESPIDSIRWQAISGGGTLTQGVISGVTVSNIFPTGDLYSRTITDADGSRLFLNVFVNKNTSQTQVDLRKVAGDYVIVVTADGSTNIVEQQSSTQMDLSDSLEVRVLFADDGQLAGGAGSIPIAPYQTITGGFSDSSEVDGCVNEFVFSHTFDFSIDFTSGDTDPTRLPSLRKTGDLASLTTSSVPQSADVVQTYPNPFNPSATVQFMLEESGPAVLKIYNMIGKEVAELFRGEAEKGLTYRFTFNASDFASGMYYARLEAGGRQYTQKMILMK